MTFNKMLLFWCIFLCAWD